MTKRINRASNLISFPHKYLWLLAIVIISFFAAGAQATTYQMTYYADGADHFYTPTIYLTSGGTHTFSVNGVPYGSYNYVAYKDTGSGYTEIWSSSTSIGYDPSFSTYVSPNYKVKLVIYDGSWNVKSVYYWYIYLAQITAADITSVSVSPDPVVAGSSITVSYTVNNTGNYARSFSIGGEILQGSTVKADLGCKTTSTISPGSSSSSSFTYTVPSGWSGGTYTARCVAWSGSCGTGWLDSRDDNFTVEARVTAADVISVSVSPDPVVAGNAITINYTVKNTGNYSRNFSIGGEVWEGSTLKADLGCSSTSTISSNSTYSSSFSYPVPSGWTGGTYTARCIAWSGDCGGTWLDSYDINFTVNAQIISADISSVSVVPNPVTAGNSITISYNVKNTGNVPQSFSIGGEIRQNDVAVDDAGCFNTPVLAVNETYSGSSFSYNVPSNYSGNYVARCIAWSGGGCGVAWEDSADDNFTVDYNISGRIAYHSYTSYEAMDSSISICDLQDQSPYSMLAIEQGTVNAMNAHFSPDGSMLVFMADPIGSSSAWWDMEIYLYDFTTDSLLQLTDNGFPSEDPKISPDGRMIVFKQYVPSLDSSDIFTIALDGTDLSRLTETSVEESGPYFSPDGSKITYWIQSNADAEVWWMDSDGSNQIKLVDYSNIQDMYPVFLTSDKVLYTSWPSSTNLTDEIHLFTISSGIDVRLPVNIYSSEGDADAFPISGNLIGFFSRRGVISPEIGNDLYIGDISSGDVWPLTFASTSIDDLGGCYTPIINPPSTRAVTVTSIPDGATFTISGEGVNTFEETATTPWNDSQMQPGNYTINWWPIADYTAPAPETQYLVSGTISFAGNYALSPLGTIAIDPSPDSLNAPWYIEGPSGYSLTSQGDQLLTDLEPGDYTLTWGIIDDWNLPIPAQETETLPTSGSITFSGTYTLPNPDITGEGEVNLLDFSSLSSKWPLADCTDLNDWCQGADINHSGSVGIDDLLIMAEHWLEINMLLIDDFESGDLSSWSFGGDTPWVISSDEKNSGDYAANSGIIIDDQWTYMYKTQDVPRGYISFARKVSSEYGYDWFVFYIDGEAVDIAGGDSDWKERQYFVNAGTYDFYWAYQKDSSVSEGSDSIWVDDIVFYPQAANSEVCSWAELRAYKILGEDMNIVPGAECGYVPNYETWIIGALDGGFTGTFNCPTSGQYELRVTHQTSASAGCPGGGYAPVTISVNGSTIVSNYDPAENHGGTHGSVTDSWTINANAGSNTFEWTANDLCTNYWIQKIEVVFID